MRKRKRNVFIAGLLCIIMAMGVVGCGSASDSAMTMEATAEYAMDYDNGAYYADEEYVEEEYVEEGSFSTTGNTTSTEQADVAGKRKLIKTVNLSLETLEFDALIDQIREKVTGMEGYIESSNVYNGSDYEEYSYRTREASFVARIPQNQLDAFLSDVSAAANVTNCSENVEDVTLQYVDMESHKKVLLTEQERLLAFLEQATNMEDIITLENRLSDVRYEIESMESKLRTYDNKVNYSTVYISVREVKKYTPIEEETLWDRMKNGFTESILDVEDGLLDFLVGFIIAIPYLLVYAFFIAIVVIIIRAIIKSSKKRNAKKEALKAQMANQQGKNPSMENTTKNNCSEDHKQESN